MEASTSTCRPCFGRSVARLSTRSHRADRRSLQVVCGESRIGKQPVPLPASVKTKLDGRYLQVEGPKGKLDFTFPPDVALEIEENRIVISRVLDNRKKSKAMHGLARALCNNMVIGVSEGYEKKLIMIGVGYRAAVKGNTLTLSVGFCHPVNLDIPEGIKISVEKNTELTITGYDKEVVGNFAAVIRRQRPPEPYKGKGIKYHDEIIRMKEGKKGK
ncbi:hypothetical protein BSKO_08316 [Bryopsis sp. KO-2023]|nr:hypothetical protein BSKO_08316 [Bryopsis sp. KO-2023]